MSLTCSFRANDCNTRRLKKNTRFLKLLVYVSCTENFTLCNAIHVSIILLNFLPHYNRRTWIRNRFKINVFQISQKRLREEKKKSQNPYMKKYIYIWCLSVYVTRIPKASPTTEDMKFSLKGFSVSLSPCRIYKYMCVYGMYLDVQKPDISRIASG